jgi:hypothetical protein
MKTTSELKSKMAPHIERYLALKQALGREYDGVRRVLVHLDRFVTTHGGELTGRNFRWLVFDTAAPGIRNSPRPHAGSKKFLPLQTSL